jgi:hypothetical protein
MTPMQIFARLSSLVPPPRFPLQRLPGVFGPRSPLRGRGPARAGESWGDGDVAARQKKKRMAKTPDDASPFFASSEGMLPERW